METNDLFVSASRSKLRFATSRGHLSVEDLWDLSLRDLDTIAVSIATTLAPEKVTFLENPDPKASKAAAEENLRLDILKVVISTKQDENKATRAKQDAIKQKAFLADLLERKKINNLESLSVEELEAKLKELGE